MEVQKFIFNEAVYIGEGARKYLDEEMMKRGFTKSFIVTDKNLFELGTAKKITDILEANNIEQEVFYNIKSNSSIEEMNEGLAKCKIYKPDNIIAIGGASSIETAKAISILYTNQDKTIDDLKGYSSTVTPNKGLPLIAIPTTWGTSSENTSNFEITDTKNRIKIVCSNEDSLPIISIVDTELMNTIPAHIAAETGINSLTHAIEGYISKNSNTITKMFCAQAIELIYNNLEKAVNKRNQDAVDCVAYGEYIAGMGFSDLGVGLIDSMANQLECIYEVRQGLASALILPVVLEYNGEACYEDYRMLLTRAMGINAKDFTKEEVIKTFCNLIRNLIYDLGIRSTLKEIGVKKEDIDMLSDKAMDDPFRNANPRETFKQTIMELYEKAW